MLGVERNWCQVTVALILFLFSLSKLVAYATSGSSPGFTANIPLGLGPKITETIRALESLQYMTSSGTWVRLDKEKLFAGVRRSRLYTGSKIRRQIMDKQHDPNVRVVDTDCLDEALRLKRQGFKPVVLDMAHRDIPGGDYRTDGNTQEAGLFRRTNLYQCLDTEPRRTTYYPLPIQGGVYCPNMVVLRKSSQENDAFMDRPDWMSFLVMAPIRNPPLVPDKSNKMIHGEKAVIITKKKIQNMFRIALENGHDAIVLSAFGCGRLGNPPESTARMFKEIIQKDYMGGNKQGRTFAEIVFAISTDSTTDNESRTETENENEVTGSENYDAFKRIMEGPDEEEDDDEEWEP